MSENVKVSVIVPVYNVDKYVEECLYSILNQTLREIEVICVDDGSTDNSGDLLDRIAREDERIIVIHKKNTGYGDTINTGIKNSKGKYIAILESDDFAEPNMYEKLYNTAEKYDSQVTKCNFNFYNSADGSKLPNEDLGVITYYNVVCGTDEIFYAPPAIWAGIYRRDYLRDNDIWVLDTPGASFQDTAFAFKIMLCADRIVGIKDALINYRIDNADSSVKDTGKVFCICNEMEEVERFMHKHGKDEFMDVFVRVKYMRYRWNLDRLADEQKRKFLLKMHYEFEKHSFEGHVIRKYYFKEEWIFVNRLIFDFDGLYRDIFDDRLTEEDYNNANLNAVRKIMSNSDPVYVYGAGIRGRKVINMLEEWGVKIAGVIVTSAEDNPVEICGHLVMSVDDNRIDNDRLVVLGVGENYMQEVKDVLVSKRIDNYISLV